MTITYFQFRPESSLPDSSYLGPFRAVVVIDESITLDWQSKVSTWLVKSGCLYMLAWGKGSSAWDDSVDLANLEEFDFGSIPEDKFVMTTWHEDESVEDVFRFSKNDAIHPKVKLTNTIILHISNKNKEKEIMSEYASA
jgi:hypothetical protein